MTRPLSQFMAKPYNFKDKDLPQFNDIRVISIQNIDDSTNIITLITRSLSNNTKYYIQKIQLTNVNKPNDNTINFNDLPKFNCNCKSFKFEYETLLHYTDNLLGTPSSIKRPKKQHRTFICKHLYGCILYLLRFKNYDKIRELTVTVKK
jgi:hypothetical protein